MRIGLDFDNTIVSYDAIFHKVALELGVIPQGISVNKVAVRDHLRAERSESVWTEMQGTVYGARMDEAIAYPGVTKFLGWATDAGHELAIISHKTRHPFLGPKYDLHVSAQKWIDAHLCLDGKPLVSPQQVYFELTKEEKLTRISRFGCDLFVDDLPEILLADGFPTATQRVLFDPEGNHESEMVGDPVRVRSWDELARWLRA